MLLRWYCVCYHWTLRKAVIAAVYRVTQLSESRTVAVESRSIRRVAAPCNGTLSEVLCAWKIGTTCLRYFGLSLHGHVYQRLIYRDSISSSYRLRSEHYSAVSYSSFRQCCKMTVLDFCVAIRPILIRPTLVTTHVMTVVIERIGLTQRLGLFPAQITN